MITDDIQELTQKMVTTQEALFPDLPIFYEDSDGEPDEENIWCRFVINPDTSTSSAMTSGYMREQTGNAVLQIMQPKSLAVTDEQLDRWQIAEQVQNAFQGFRGPNNLMSIRSMSAQRHSDDLYLIVNVAIFWRSNRMS